MQATTQPAFFKQGPRPLSRFFLYASLSLVLMAVDVHWHWLQQVRTTVSVVLYPIERIATSPVAAMHRVGDFFATQSDLQRENRQLQDDKLMANAQSLRMQSLQLENAQLKRLLSTPSAKQGKGILTEVLYNGRDPFAAKLVLDRGQTSGVKAGEVVIDPQGVVGQITSVQLLTSEVTLISDKNQPVPVQVVRSGLRAVVFGLGREYPLEVRFMPLNNDVRVDDILVTSGIDGTYPVGLPVARVTQVDRNTGSAFAQISCEPVADLDKHRFFLILNEQRVLPPPPPQTAVLPSREPSQRSVHGKHHQATE